ncbi:hypothetical protein PIB30_013644 [Stylosanthes scabra]|uniref:Uncharacterized protein n=1 Tax=Stylosanthes scabra TaxID=79078 RepID=A0ABU6V4X0_9FABA|nr:hypothetical protein [Stylosanthes scabra]
MASSERLEAMVQGLEVIVQFLLEEAMISMKSVVFNIADNVLIRWQKKEYLSYWRLNFQRNKLYNLFHQVGHLKFNLTAKNKFKYAQRWLKMANDVGARRVNYKLVYY